MTQHISKAELAELIRTRDFPKLFIKFGWDQDLPSSLLKLEAGGHEFSLTRVAQKRGFVICVCDAGEDYPKDKDIRRKLLRQLGKFHYEHLLIILGENKQCWALTIRPQNRPLRFVEVDWHEDQYPEMLIQKLDGMLFDISEEETLGITDVVERVRSAFVEGAEKITKSFYQKFQQELKAFSGFIDGIHEQVSKDWYAALMLNRLMFIYFIQKRHFLDDDPNYLESRLKQTQEKYGKDEFHSHFYRHFLRRLFTGGLGTPVEDRDPELKQLLGNIPYLNGGLFDLHTIEEQNDDIQIPDEAFDRLFQFFNKYNWHLDSRPTAKGKDISPDVLGYIFEKYINDRAEMGAYYTQEDVTGYIARTTIIPFLLGRAKEQCANAFNANGIWRCLRENPDNYIYEAARKGCDISDDQLPEKIRLGVDTSAPDLLARRRYWNEKADEKFALPTETWREMIARRERYFALKTKMKSGGIQDVDDLVTHNLDIQRFAEDALNDYEGSDFIEAFYAAIAGRKALRSNWKTRRGLTVLDPACGSGAFLFAALNVLEPLYRACVERMKDFVKEDDRLREQGARKGTKKHLQFRDVLNQISTHPNERYWIYKTIILNNLYGVDLMKEAAEIAKLRLFLKLAAEAEYSPDKNNLGLEPLPDIDFNIRAGNSLVGFASMADFDKFGDSELDLSGGIGKVHWKAKLVQMANERFREVQKQGARTYQQQAKKELSGRLDDLNQNMNHYLADQYGIDHNAKPKEYAQWQQSHQPFHWPAEFQVSWEENGGFDVVIGNPPYVEYDKKLKQQYSIKKSRVEKAGNLHAFFIERNNLIMSGSGLTGMIVPHSAFCTDRMSCLTPILENKKMWISTYGIRPAKLFADAEQRLAIYFLSQRKGNVYSSVYMRWNADYRDCLFHAIGYGFVPSHKLVNTTPKIGDRVSAGILEKICEHSTLRVNERGAHQIYFHNAPRYWIRATDFVPYFYNERDGEKQSDHVKTLTFSNRAYALAVCALLNSSLFYWWFIICSNCRDLNMREIENFPFDPHYVNQGILNELSSMVSDLMADYRCHIVRKETRYKATGKVVYDEFHPGHSKAILDRIDATLAKYYGFTEAELDYIINYDIKYRMGGAQDE
ncbi:MAG: Eco57I restriction-modification methylase domain-containing protein [Gammaproteobacteria bacterium]|nr:Eco57I restriction-modification methylase domain-containing protein [Gammaproteobacteria bacterium]